MKREEKEESHHHFHGPLMGLCAKVARTGVQLCVPDVSLQGEK